MSKIGQSSVIGKLFKPIITPATESKLKELKADGKSLGISNGFIISIPQDDNGNDIEGAGSIWMTDADGYLYQLTESINGSI